jgi:hypothetical protein
MKTKRILSASGAALFVTSLLLALAPAARATNFPDLTYLVTLTLNPSFDTSNNSNGPFSLDFQLDTGSGAPNIVNTVKLTSFTFTGGSASATPDFTSGGESGSIASGITLTTGPTPVAQGDNEYAVQFSPGVTKITFKVDETPNSELVTSGTPVPDQFNVAILDNGLNNIPTTDFLADTLVSSAISDSETVGSVDTFSSISPDGGVVAIATPEPHSVILGLIAMCGMLGTVIIRRRFVA